MSNFIITITEQLKFSDSDRDGSEVEHYRRRVETDELATVIQRLDQALNVKVRRRRRDAGQQRTEATPTLPQQ